MLQFLNENKNVNHTHAMIFLQLERRGAHEQHRTTAADVLPAYLKTQPSERIPCPLFGASAMRPENSRTDNMHATFKKQSSSPRTPLLIARVECEWM